MKELREAGKTNIDMVEWEQVHRIWSNLFEREFLTKSYDTTQHVY